MENKLIPANKIKIVAYNEEGEEIACSIGFESEEDLMENFDNFAEQYYRTEMIEIK